MVCSALFVVSACQVTAYISHPDTSVQRGRHPYDSKRGETLFSLCVCVRAIDLRTMSGDNGLSICALCCRENACEE